MQHALVNLLTRYRPADALEQADVDAVLELARAAEDPWSQSIPLHVTASALVVHPATKRVLLRWHTRQQAWLQIGGHGDAGESDPIEVALREGVEETGLSDLIPWPAADLVHVAIVPVAAKSNSVAPGGQAHEHADLRFVLATGDPEAARPEREDAPLRWLTIAEATALTVEDNLRETLVRVAALLAD